MGNTSLPNGLVSFDNYNFDPVFLEKCPDDYSVLGSGVNILSPCDMQLADGKFSQETEKFIRIICDNKLGGWRVPINGRRYWFHHRDYQKVVKICDARSKRLIHFLFLAPNEIYYKLKTPHGVNNVLEGNMAKKYQEVYGVLPKEHKEINLLSSLQEPPKS